MKVNIYYGGRGVLDDPTLYVLNKMEEVLKELRVTVERINIVEHKNEITTLPQTLKDADGIILGTTVEQSLLFTAEGEMRDHAQAVERHHTAVRKLRRGRAGKAGGQLDDQIRPAFKRHARARPLVMPGKMPALSQRAAHHADDEICPAFFARHGQMMRVPPVKGVVFADDAADKHGFLLPQPHDFWISLNKFK